METGPVLGAEGLPGTSAGFQGAPNPLGATPLPPGGACAGLASTQDIRQNAIGVPPSAVWYHQRHPGQMQMPLFVPSLPVMPVQQLMPLAPALHPQPAGMHAIPQGATHAAPGGLQLPYGIAMGAGGRPGCGASLQMSVPGGPAAVASAQPPYGHLPAALAIAPAGGARPKGQPAVAPFRPSPFAAGLSEQQLVMAAGGGAMCHGGVVDAPPTAIDPMLAPYVHPAATASDASGVAELHAAALPHGELNGAGVNSSGWLDSLAWAGQVVLQGGPNVLQGGPKPLTAHPGHIHVRVQPMGRGGRGMPSSAPRRTEVPAIRLRKGTEFIQQTGRRPTRKSSDPVEKSLGIWLHRFTCNDDGVKDRAQAALSAEEFSSMVALIENSPDAKQVSDRAIALSNIEQIAERAAALNALPLRGDASGCGRKLHNIRQGRLGPSMRDEALAIVRRVVGNSPQNANVRAPQSCCPPCPPAPRISSSFGSRLVSRRAPAPQVLKHLEASIEQSVARHTEAQSLSIGRANKRSISLASGEHEGLQDSPNTCQRLADSPLIAISGEGSPGAEDGLVPCVVASATHTSLSYATQRDVEGLAISPAHGVASVNGSMPSEVPEYAPSLLLHLDAVDQSTAIPATRDADATACAPDETVSTIASSAMDDNALGHYD